MPTARVKEILSWYASENPGVKANLARMMKFVKTNGDFFCFMLRNMDGHGHAGDQECDEEKGDFFHGQEGF